MTCRSRHELLMLMLMVNQTAARPCLARASLIQPEQPVFSAHDNDRPLPWSLRDLLDPCRFYCVTPSRLFDVSLQGTFAWWL
ncbi:hypothetical protein BGW36DRAFT_40938 [Talaromyces proteolyticus]|uniref:Secreted protein n=1 Tax=Talaromyces proteolyticus TaxID=1131652 RepID=A0AAD4KNK0_9EURO|nr:uncharacterized protein BGW36DRAFT_40938 [Talaromyces proteolyticus]KAH8692045.1 hypothetical protein BGW36DRAFT_40938 [Talaromyces proteolyticus]